MTVKHAEWSGKPQEGRNGEILVHGYLTTLSLSSMVCVTPQTLSRFLLNLTIMLG